MRSPIPRITTAIATVVGVSLYYSARSFDNGRSSRGLKELSFSESAHRKPHPRNIFIASGWDYRPNRQPRILKDLFPDFNGEVFGLEWTAMPWETKFTQEENEAIRVRNRKFINETATGDDLLLGNILQVEVAFDDCLNAFPGKQLYLNAEPIDFSGDGSPQVKDWKARGLPEPDLYDYLPPSDKIFVLGPHQDTNTSIRLTYAQQFVLWDLWDENVWSKLLHERPKNTKEHFLIYLATHYIPFREKAAWDIAQIGKSLHTNGHCEGNKFSHRIADGNKCTAHPDPRPSYIQPSPYLNASGGDTRLWAISSKIYANYRFALVMENTFRDGYITEKIVNAFVGGSIPIWYGTRGVFDIFNKKAFIFYDVRDPEPALARISYLESNPEAYDEMLSEPILTQGEKTIEEYFSMRDEIGGGRLKNRILQMMGYAAPTNISESIYQ